MVLVAVPALPEASVDVKVIVYVPAPRCGSNPELTTVTAPERSVAVAPASAYKLPSSTVTLAVPLRVTAGAVVSVTFTVLVAVPALPEASVDV